LLPKLIIGLGNPGSEYKNTRHNAGFIAVDFLSRQWKASFKESAYDALLARTKIDSEDVILAKPLTYMNLSGKAVRPLFKKYGGKVEDLLIIYDDLDLKLGQIRFRKKGKSGGHHGMASVIAALGREDIPRLKIGIGRPSADVDPIDYVLSPFSRQEWEIIENLLPAMEEGIKCFIKEGIEEAMNLYNATRRIST